MLNFDPCKLPTKFEDYIRTHWQTDKHTDRVQSTLTHSKIVLYRLIGYPYELVHFVSELLRLRDLDVTVKQHRELYLP